MKKSIIVLVLVLIAFLAGATTASERNSKNLPPGTIGLIVDNGENFSGLNMTLWMLTPTTRLVANNNGVPSYNVTTLKNSDYQSNGFNEMMMNCLPQKQNMVDQALLPTSNVSLSTCAWMILSPTQHSNLEVSGIKNSVAYNMANLNKATYNEQNTELIANMSELSTAKNGAN